jgi:CelD/BcsL family acetyltransferase involved in cellulose biosynthesis
MSNVTLGSPRDLDSNAPLKGEWDALVERMDLGLGYQFDWARILWQIHQENHDLALLIIRDGDRLIGLAPLVKKVVWQKGVPLRCVASLFAFHEIHGTHFIHAEDRAESIGKVLDHLRGIGNDWDLWTMHFVKGDKQAELFEMELRRHGLHFTVADTKRSPYMPLKGSWEEQGKSLQSRFRTTVRSRERRLREKEKVTLEYFDTPSKLEFGLKAIQIVEADSWKLGAGTALTEDPKQWPFYVQYGEFAAANASLRLPVLFINGEPVAYDYSVYHKGVYYLLKTSYRNAYQLDYPGTILRKLVVENLCAEKAEEFDFLGLDEEWKMKWTDVVKEHIVYTVINRNLRGRYALLMGNVAKLVKDVQGRAADTPVPLAQTPSEP